MKKRKKQPQIQGKKLDLVLICIYEILASLSVFVFHLRFYQSTLLFFFIPAVFLIFRKTKKLKHIFLASIGGLSIGFILDFFTTLNKAWYVPSDQLAIPFRILGVVPVDDLIWFVGWVFFMTTFYEHFLDRSRIQRTSAHVRYAIPFSVILLFALLVMYYFNPQFFVFRLAYLLVCSSVLPFFIFMLFHKPSLILSYLKLTLFFTPLFLVFELTALANHQWSFPGYYIGHVELFGLTMPFEEFFFWIMISSSVVLSYYEFFLEE